MAIAFELVVNFGADEAAALAARDLVVAAGAFDVGRRAIALHEPLLHHVRGADDVPYLQMSVLPVGVGWGVALDAGHEHVLLSAVDLTGLGHQMYQLLRAFTGYRAACVGWDPEQFADPGELRQEWAAEVAGGDLPGLVLAEDLLIELRGTAFRPFVPGFVWTPYAGERISALTADADEPSDGERTPSPG